MQLCLQELRQLSHDRPDAFRHDKMRGQAGFRCAGGRRDGLVRARSAARDDDIASPVERLAEVIREPSDLVAAKPDTEQVVTLDKQPPAFAEHRRQARQLLQRRRRKAEVNATHLMHLPVPSPAVSALPACAGRMSRRRR